MKEISENKEIKEISENKEIETEIDFKSILMLFWERKFLIIRKSTIYTPVAIL